MRKLLCFIGYHRFTFMLSELKGKPIPKYGMPGFARCEFCGTHYDKTLDINPTLK